MTHKKNGFWRLVFSLLPGAGEMYMGFMKMGISLMGLFFGIVAIATWLELGPLIFIAVIVWFYGFFHVHNLAGAPDEEFYAIEDDYLFHLTDGRQSGRELLKNYHNIIAALLIIIGVIMLWKGFYYMLGYYIPQEIIWQMEGLSYRLPQMIAGAAIIVIGIYMIRGKKQELDDTRDSQPKQEEKKEEV